MPKEMHCPRCNGNRQSRRRNSDGTIQFCCSTTGCTFEWNERMAHVYMVEKEYRPKQPPFFAEPESKEPTPKDVERGNLRDLTEEWIKENPEIANLFLKFAQEMARRGEKFGVNFLRERIRWECPSVANGDRFKFRNDFAPYVARWLIKQDPSLEPFMTFRETKW